MKPSLLLFYLSPALLLLVLSFGPQSPPAKPRVIRVNCLPARPLALVVAQDKGFFSKYGLEVQSEVAANSEDLRTALAEGRFDLAHAAVDNAVAMDEKASTDVVIVMGGDGSTNELIAQPEIHSIDDLRGKTLIVDAPTTAFALQLKKILLLNGLRAGSDYQLKTIGGTPLRLAAMREHKEYAASMLGPPTSLIAKQDGFVSLGTAHQFLGPSQGIGGFARRDWATRNRDLVIDYIASFVEAQRWLLDPAHKQEVINLLVQQAKLSQALAIETYEAWIIAPEGLQPDAMLDLVGFQNVLKLRADIQGSWNGKPPNTDNYYDNSYYHAGVAIISTPQ